MHGRVVDLFLVYISWQKISKPDVKWYALQMIILHNNGTHQSSVFAPFARYLQIFHFVTHAFCQPPAMGRGVGDILVTCLPCHRHAVCALPVPQPATVCTCVYQWWLPVCTGIDSLPLQDQLHLWLRTGLSHGWVQGQCKVMYNFQYSGIRL